MKTVFWFAAVVLTIGACASTDQQAQRNYMDGDQIRSLLSERVTLMLAGPEDSFTGSLTISPNGTAVGEALTKENKKLDVSGTWEVDGNQLCRRWAFNKPKRVCEDWERTGEHEITVWIDNKMVATNTW